METEPYITTVEDLDKFLEEMETVVQQLTPPVTPKKVIRFVNHTHNNFILKDCDNIN